MIQHAQLPIPVPIRQMQNEVTALSAGWQPHFNVKQYEGEWTVLALRSSSGDAGQIVPETSSDQEFFNTPLLASCAAIQQVVNDLQCEVRAVRLMKLKAGAVIKTHRDHDLAFEKGEARLHFPVFTNAAVAFFVNGVQVKMQEGECWYVNVNLPHSVTNHGATDRVHLVVDCLVNDWLKELFAKADTVETPQAPQEEAVTRKMIQELRLQNTETTHRLADELERNLS